MVKKYVIFIYFLAMLILLAMAVTSCRSVRYVPVETVKHDSVYFNKVVRDSIHVKDSVLVIVKGDTVTEFRYKYVDRHHPCPLPCGSQADQVAAVQDGGWRVCDSTCRYPCNCCGRILCDENQEITTPDGAIPSFSFYKPIHYGTKKIRYGIA